MSAVPLTQQQVIAELVRLAEELGQAEDEKVRHEICRVADKHLDNLCALMLDPEATP